MKTITCPHCQQSINRFFLPTTFWPKNGVWYKPKQAFKQCPKCQQYLQHKLPDIRIFLLPLLLCKFFIYIDSSMYYLILDGTILTLACGFLLYELLAKFPYKKFETS